MIGDDLMDEQEMEPEDLTVRVLSKDEILQDHQQQLLELFKSGYGDDWLGDDVFWNVRMKNGTDVLELQSNNQIAAAIIFDNLRISLITVHPDFQGQGLGVRLFQEAAKAHSKAWISVATNADAVIRTITDSKLNFMPVEDKNKIEVLLGETNGSRNSSEVDIEEIEIPLLSERLAKKGIQEEKFVVYAAKTGSTHGSGYKQVLFQNQPNSTS